MDVLEDTDEEEEEESDDDEASTNEVWVFVSPGTDQVLHPLIFTGQPGWRADVRVDDLETPGDYCDQFLPPELFYNLALWTNARAGILKAEKPLFTFKDVTMPEMRSFFGATLLMGIVKKPFIRQYWSTSNLVQTPIFNQIMGRDRYSQILRFIRFSDPTEPEARDKSHRLRDFDIIAGDACLKYTPEAEVSLDESLLLFKGRLSFRQFIRIKRARFGIKLFILTDIYGYMIAYQPYFGKGTDYECDENGIGHLSKTEKIVVVLLARAGFLDKGYIVTVDNFYCSVRLARYLFSRSTGIRGTIRANRGVPKDLKNKQMTPISSCFMRNNECLITKFCDKRDVYVLSTVDVAGTVEKERVVKGGEVKVFQKPTVINKYNQTMGGVDRGDQLISPIACVRKTHAWFKKVGLHLCQRLVLNASVLFSKQKVKKPFMDFSLQVISHLTGIEMSSERRRSLPRPGPAGDAVRVERHLPVPLPATENDNKPRRRCKKCYKDGKKAIKTRYFCDGCDNKPELCVDCFIPWHADRA